MTATRLLPSHELRQHTLGDRAPHPSGLAGRSPGRGGPRLGFPVGGVAAMESEDGVISPGGVGYDINCGVRLLASDLDLAAARPHLEATVHDLSRSIPSGSGQHSQLDLAAAELDRVLDESCALLLERGLAVPEDLPNTEAGAGSRGPAARASPSRQSSAARSARYDRLGEPLRGGAARR
ncbi:MAG: RtcB family protein [Gemmatimonadales bacterium]